MREPGRTAEEIGGVYTWEISSSTNCLHYRTAVTYDVNTW